MQVELSVIAPCYNEAGNLPELVERLQRVFARRAIAGEIVLVDDGSTDGTAQAIQALSRSHPSVRACFHHTNRGIEAAWETGLAACRGAHVCLIDADLQYQPEDVWRLYRELRISNADLVQGVRSSIGRLRDSRLFLSLGLNFLLNALFRLQLKDAKSGFVVCRKETLQDILRHRYRYRYFQTFITVSARAKGYSVRQVETLFESRLVGRSFIPSFPLAIIVGSFVDLAKGWLEFRWTSWKDETLPEFLAEHRVPPGEPEPQPWRRLRFRVFLSTMPLHKWLITARAGEYLAELRRSQWLGPAEVRALQERKLRRLVDHAYRHVPYYREAFERAGVRPEEIRTLDDLRRLPLLDRSDVRDNLFDLLSDSHDKKRMLRITTSGSTGEPLVCFADQHQLEMRWAATLRSMEWSGYRFGDRQARLWHQTLGMSWSQVLREWLDARLCRRLFIPAFRMSERNLERIVARLRPYRPVLIDGYAEAFNLLAEFVKHHGAVDLKVRAVISSAQILPDQSRRLIEEAFACRVFDKYGSREFSGIAYECEAHDGHHVVAESYVVEILRDGQPARPGESGEVVITDLNNRCMPFIRYRIGDLAVAMDAHSVCACSRGLPRIGRIEGRIQAIIVGTNGVYLPGTFFAHLFKDYDHVVRQYQVVQETEGRIRLNVVKGLRYEDDTFEGILRILRRTLGQDMVIDVEYVDQIPLGATGKRQGSVSKLAIDFQRL